MANRAYLVANDDSRSAGASDDGATYDGSEILAAASSIIPALWLTLFAEENALHHPRRGSTDSDAPVTHEGRPEAFSVAPQIAQRDISRQSRSNLSV
jgi:hypothetical protein